MKNSNAKKLNQKIVNLNNQVSSLNEEVASLNSKIEELTSAIDSIKSQQQQPQTTKGQAVSFLSSISSFELFLLIGECFTYIVAVYAGIVGTFTFVSPIANYLAILAGLSKLISKGKPLYRCILVSISEIKNWLRVKKLSKWTI